MPAIPFLMALLVIWHIAARHSVATCRAQPEVEAPLSSWVCQIMYCVLGNLIMNMSLIKFCYWALLKNGLHT